MRPTTLDDFVRPTTYEKKEIKPGNTQEYEFHVSDINRDYHLEDYKGKIEIGFAKPDGTLYTETFKWNGFKLNTKNLGNL